MSPARSGSILASTMGGAAGMELSRTLAGSHVADAMTNGVISCSPETPLRIVARMMTVHRVHAVYVIDYGNEDDETVELWGIVSDLDIVAAAVDYLDARTAGESSVTPLVVVHSDDPLEHAAALMAENAVSHLAVLDPLTGRPVGVLSTLDIARVVSTS
jgi:CBS domain-containing protein